MGYGHSDLAVKKNIGGRDLIPTATVKCVVLKNKKFNLNFLHVSYLCCIHYSPLLYFYITFYLEAVNVLD